MTEPSAFRATFSDMKLVKTRQVAQLIFEIPIEEFDAAYEVLGGMPVPSKERWFGIAAIKTGKEAIQPTAPATPRRLDKPAGAKLEKRPWRDLPKSQQAGICINEPEFSAYLREEHPREWRETQDADACLKLMCGGIASKSELVTNHAAGALWFQIDAAYHAWKAFENA